MGNPQNGKNGASILRSGTAKTVRVIRKRGEVRITTYSPTALRASKLDRTLRIIDKRH
jgi:hypothetical protein